MRREFLSLKRTKVAVLGAGNWGRNHIRTLASLPEAELAAICDLDSERRAQIAREFPGALIVSSPAEAIDVADAVVVATPAATHVELAKQAVQSGVPVLVEKPLALTLEDATSIADLSESAGVPCLVGHLLVFHPAVEMLRKMIQTGELGDIFYLYSQRVNLGQVRPDENALWSFGPHDVSVALYLLDETPTKVSANGKSYIQPDVEDVVFLTMEFKSGVTMHAQMSWLDPHKERRLTVVGSKKMVVWDDMEPREKVKVYDKGVDRPPNYKSYGESLAIREGDIFVPKVSNTEPLVLELQHFIDVVKGAAPGAASARSGVEVVKVLSAATKSLAQDGMAVAL